MKNKTLQKRAIEAEDEPKIAQKKIKRAKSDGHKGVSVKEDAEIPKISRISRPSKTKRHAQGRVASGKTDDGMPATDDIASDTDEILQDQTEVVLQGLDSSSEDELGELPVPALPLLKSSKKDLEKARKSADGPGVLYLGRLPKGFFEHQIRAYFSQFGPVSRLRLSRSVKTGNAKHYGFLEFESLEVAKIAAATMDNYLMYGHILKCKVVPAENIHDSLWKGANKRFKAVPWNKIEGRKLERPASETQWNKRKVSEEKRRATKLAKAQKIGYEFVAPKLKVPRSNGKMTRQKDAQAEAIST